MQPLRALYALTLALVLVGVTADPSFVAFDDALAFKLQQAQAPWNSFYMHQEEKMPSNDDIFDFSVDPTGDAATTTNATAVLLASRVHRMNRMLLSSAQASEGLVTLADEADDAAPPVLIAPAPPVLIAPKPPVVIAPAPPNLAIKTKLGHYPRCDEDPVTNAPCSINVLLAVSKCLDTSVVTMFHSWVNSLYASGHKFLSGGRVCPIKYATAIMSGCDPNAAAEALAAKSTSAASKVLRPQDLAEKQLRNGAKRQPMMLLSEHQELMDATIQKNDDLVAQFIQYGDVYCSLNETRAATATHFKPDAVISIFSDAISHADITSFEEDQGVATVFNFQMCHHASTTSDICGGGVQSFDDSLQLSEPVDLFLHNPFKIVQNFHCAKSLPNGLPVTYLDALTNTRQCFCKCPTGYEYASIGTSQGLIKQCVPSPKENCACHWSNRKYLYEVTSYDADRDETNLCRITELFPRTINHIPYPKSNYVSLNRDNNANSGEGVAIHVEVDFHSVVVATTSTADGDSAGTGDIAAPTRTTTTKDIVVTAHDYPWSDFEHSRREIIRALNFTAPGLYTLKMTATGYRSSADCEVCLAIVDKFRPTSKQQCPHPICEDDGCNARKSPVQTAEYTAKNLARAEALVRQQIAYGSNANVRNDACGEYPNQIAAQRCDLKTFSRQDFFQARYTEADVSSGSHCFHDVVNDAINARLQVTPFGVSEGDTSLLQLVSPVAPGQCTRCCSYTTKLREYWRDYKCPTNASAPLVVPPLQCSGSDPGCTLNQCLVAYGATFFTAAASVEVTYKAATVDLIENLFPDKGYQALTEIHLLLECSEFGKKDEGKCSHIAAIHELITVSSQLNDRTILPESAEDAPNANAYVAWRYRVIGGDSDTNGAWHAFNSSTQVRFDTAQATIAIEAWSQCGLVKAMTFTVFLHLNRKLCVADEFEHMWYQATSDGDTTHGGLCNYRESDFAELTFDFDPMQGIICHRQTLPWVSSGVDCWIQYNDRKNAPPARLLSSQAVNASLIRRFSVQMLTIPTTKADTDITVSCDFHYTGYNRTTTKVSVSKTFTIHNCERPGWDCPFGECSTNCTRDQPTLGAPFQACAGHRVYANETATLTTTATRGCCTFCGVATCESILGIPRPSTAQNVDDEDIYRCHSHDTPPPTGPAAVVFALVQSMLQNLNTNPSAMLLGGSSLLVGLVAAFVVRRHQDAVRREQLEYTDGYYPLVG